MKVQDVKLWMKDQKITQEALAKELGYAHRVTVAMNLSKEKETVSPEFLGRMATRYPEVTMQLLQSTAVQSAPPECA